MGEHRLFLPHHSVVLWRFRCHRWHQLLLPWLLFLVSKSKSSSKTAQCNVGILNLVSAPRRRVGWRKGTDRLTSGRSFHCYSLQALNVVQELFTRVSMSSCPSTPLSRAFDQHALSFFKPEASFHPALLVTLSAGVAVKENGDQMSFFESLVYKLFIFQGNRQAQTLCSLALSLKYLRSYTDIVSCVFLACKCWICSNASNCVFTSMQLRSLW